MTALLTLKSQLQPIINQEGLSEDFKAAISDGAYAADLSQVALEQWIDQWALSIEYTDLANAEYCKGVQFVEEKWNQITGMW